VATALNGEERKGQGGKEKGLHKMCDQGGVLLSRTLGQAKTGKKRKEKEKKKEGEPDGTR